MIIYTRDVALITIVYCTYYFIERGLSSNHKILYILISCIRIGSLLNQKSGHFQSTELGTIMERIPAALGYSM